jgi:hypothetical protein
MADINAVTQAILAIGTPLAAAIGIGSGRRRLRNEIKENLALIHEIEKDDLLKDHTPAIGWLKGRIVVDVARLARQPLGTPKKPVPKGSVTFAAVIAVLFGGWTYLIVRDGFVWYAVFPGVVCALVLISIGGMFTNRELPPDDNLPPGAVPVRSDKAAEHVASSVALAASGGLDGRFAPGGQVDVVYRFVGLAQQGHYEEALAFADDNWLRCRVQAWLWNNRDHFGDDLNSLDGLVDKMMSQRAGNATWRDLVTVEASSFVEVWGNLDLDHYGAASYRRRVAPEYDLVILAPTGNTDGYFVSSATAVPNALTFLVVQTGNGWLVANHIGSAPPRPGWPPAWWNPNDPAVAALPDA